MKNIMKILICTMLSIILLGLPFLTCKKAMIIVGSNSGEPIIFNQCANIKTSWFVSDSIEVNGVTYSNVMYIISDCQEATDEEEVQNTIVPGLTSS